MSRRGVAMRAGIPPSTLHEWLERGRAHPQEEPWGSFSVDYLQAERGLEQTASEVVGLWVVRLRELVERGYLLDSKQVSALLRVLEDRYPEDRGSSQHRRPEPEPSGDAWLERNGITHSQLVHTLREPPEPIARALVEAGDEVYALLLASGWKAKREAV